MEKNWVLLENAPEDWQGQMPEVSAILRQILWTRGLRTKAEAEQFLHPSFEKDLHDPFLFKDMEKTVARLFAAIEKKEKIFVYGDYDADGVPGAAILKTTLDALGAVTDIYIPHREKEGYGLNSGAIAYMAEQNGKIVITCDCGISNASEVAEARAKGIDVIITDHHRIPEIVPKPFAILHPLIPGEKYPNKFLTGGGVAYKLACALLQTAHNSPQPPLTLRGGEDLEGFEKWLLDLVAISTVADVGKLLDENRTLVKYGLTVLNKTRRLGLQKLIEAAGIKLGALDTYSIGWQIAPRINAAGRMDHANAAFQLLMATDAEEAQRLAAQLNESNVARQKETDRALKEAREQIMKGLLSPQSSPIKGEEVTQPPSHLAGEGRGEGELPYLLAAYNPSWNPGVIGLVAGRLMEEFRRPVLICTRNEGGKFMASARSISEFNIIEALASSKEYLLKFGGHPKAAGFSVESEEKWHALIAHLQELAHKALHAVDVRPTLYIDADLILAQVDWNLVSDVQALEPCGEGNPRPRFLIHGITVLGFDTVGNGGKHLRLTVTDETQKPRKMIGFNCGSWCERLKIGDLIDVVVEVGVNEWNGNRDIEMRIVDLRFHQ
ncbi:single-stranded-DNA-specific exonuclease RecJ [Candidatus Uhrbacteria bacterium RIFCSPLOWO2_01_FULL_47_24]|uniref:Single-stranded-DNA-specific exonuclease RecJ n=1 Tax=Candidatus Uhrbacteria bacterium RIFCSPLOWO2_01_FULL_47_24 TaxID=1802401 RepID=A0A1F7USJ1_9BACT|nr:MAG: single-stranded-DNA-specific exonuclease RecJ [Candidatus Uhrbacteria bacterium RIFCSPHIGHO2_02_FULL_46_47]OGL81216.1 MAG: single-stranded-DNA-specific exonuclease RecJ [Candidatus Uhrbacteria bacterium RIFCSPLOWO2_01_FULL_47_24]OGL84620.1 MAG: single-stranded-DNA-specific exonuclease RecJ [Candidatus Uhrbacteria bacterium RIFCSPLOWO2_02_FULL_46_25]OGL93224.1 MAG: single-stranded-DNA-specific exonuclease RecJ [Candidatus Uhrbacteria bacterium RIFCSPLOWO2_12_FULL_47_10]